MDERRARSEPEIAVQQISVGWCSVDLCISDLAIEDDRRQKKNNCVESVSWWSFLWHSGTWLTSHGSLRILESEPIRRHTGAVLSGGNWLCTLAGALALHSHGGPGRDWGVHRRPSRLAWLV